SSTGCYAWALMTNHAHLLLRNGMVPISTVMRRLLTGYAQQFNRRHNRCGVLFQNRFKSFLCEEEPYLLELVRYIHLNPIRSRVVPDLKALRSYPRCGHAVLLGRQNNDWQDTDYILKRFGAYIKTARRSYTEFVSKGIPDGRRPELVGGGLLRSVGGWSALRAIRATGMRVMGDERILGSSDFVETVLKNANEEYERRSRFRARGLSLEKIIDIVSGYFEIEKDEMKSQSRRRVVARSRAVISIVAIDQLGLRGADVARSLNLTPFAISKLILRARNDPLLKDVVNDVLKFVLTILV
ncbi:MAG: transposase, partial [Desulfobacterales bacterium]|nr:transposase [Desulfobacterales bacterium]